MMPNEIAFVAFWSKDLEAQREFFVEVMGYEVNLETPNSLVLGGPGSTIVLRRAEGDLAHLDGQTHAGYYVENIDEWAHRLAARGATILSGGVDMGEGYRAVVVQTPGGHQFALVGP